MSDPVAAFFGLSQGSAHLEEALTHPSYANEVRAGAHYQRLEFLGDAVLGLCTSELLCARFPDADEGELTRMRAKLVNAQALAEWAREHGLAAHVRLGRGAEAHGLRESTSVLCDVVEALIGAAYLDLGLEAARATCSRIVGGRLSQFDGGAARDAKSALQERIQKDGGAPPVYEVVKQEGPAHNPWFVVRVRVGTEALGEGGGKSKRAAERAAAREALARQGSDNGSVGGDDAT